MSKKILLSGYFGYDNLGDEAILYSMVEGLKDIEGVELTALSSNPERTTEKFGIKAVERMKIFPILKAIKNCDLFLSGGGSLLQDVTSKKSILYYIGLLTLAKRFFRKKTMIYSQGIGPVNDLKNRKKVGKIMNKMDLINVRDNESKIELLNMGVTKDIEVTADTVFMINNPDKNFGKSYISKTGLDVEQKTLGISIRPWKNFDDEIVRETKSVVEHLQNQGINILLLPFHHPGDLEISKKVYEMLSNKTNVHLVEEKLDERQMLSLCTQLDTILAMRLHGLIFGVVAGAYPIAISYDPKIDSLMKELDMDRIVRVESFDSNEVLAYIHEAFMDMEEQKNITRERADEMRKKALRNVELVRGLLN